ncbi:MAG: sugar-binding protein, partial [Desulfuromonadales bacterium]|nr:sugar-binding protein [Desulfuromonadales bacterium]
GLIKGENKGGKASSTEPSIGFTGGIGGGSASVVADLVDVNGDGLLDSVTGGGVALNSGYGFEDSESWGAKTTSKSTNGNIAVGGGYNKGIYDFAGGINLNNSYNVTNYTLQDLNGDGLPDRLIQDGSKLKVQFNTGAGFAGEPVQWHGAMAVDLPAAVGKTAGLPTRNVMPQSDTVGLGGGVYFTISFTIPIVQITININPGINASLNASRQELSYQDVNGDGLADQLISKKNSELKVALNQTGRTNLLRKVTRPLGGSFELSYQRSGNTYDQPQSKWVLSQVVVEDGRGNSYPTGYAYFNSGYYDRLERENYGYAHVQEVRADGATIDTFYHNRDYARKGLAFRTVLRDAGGRLFSMEDSVW